MAPDSTTFGRRDPDPRGYFGPYGGRFVPETLMAPIEALAAAYLAARADASFLAELDRLLAQYVGRPTPLYEAARLSRAAGRARILLKREDLTHTGAHKINNALGQALLAARMGKRRVVAETGAGQHGVATATACALLGLECHVYMGAEDMQRQALNVVRMELLGATVRRVTRRLGLESGQPPAPQAVLEITSLAPLRGELLSFYIDRALFVCGQTIGELPFPSGASVALIVRGQDLVPPRGDTRFEAGDHVFVFCRPEDRPLVRLLFGRPEEE